MDPLSHSTLPILLGVENFAARLPRIKYAIASLDADHLILAIAVSLEDKKLQKKAIDLLVSKIGDDPLMVIDTLKGIFDQFNEQYTEKGWGSKQLAWESLRHLRCEDCPTTIDYVTRFRLAIQRLRNLDQDLNNDLLVFELISNLGSEHVVWSTNIKNNSRTAQESPKWEVLCAELLDVARMALETNPSTALFQSKLKKNRGGPTKFCKACNTRGHDEDNCFMLHLEKAPSG